VPPSLHHTRAPPSFLVSKLRAPSFTSPTTTIFLLHHEETGTCDATLRPPFTNLGFAVMSTAFATTMHSLRD